jgi:hypothetical protein
MESKYVYPCSLDVDYSTSAEYRQLIRQIFNMQSINYPEIVYEPDIDSETKDENECDESAIHIAMDWIYSRTKDTPLFQELYSFGSARMFSVDTEIGLAILMSYDYLFYFHPILVDYFSNNNVISSENEAKIRDLIIRMNRK